MTGALYYPPADRTTQWFGSGNATVAPNKQLWHTTETAGGWPGYAGGASAPNLTYEPWQHKWRQHFPINGTARALRNGADGWPTNRQGVCQVEVSCYCDPAQFGTGRGIDRLDQQAYDDMGAFAEFLRVEWGVPLLTTVNYKPYPASYGNNGVRLDRTTFTGYHGHLDHMHAPDNTHGDAGAMDVLRILAAAQGDDCVTPEDKAWIEQKFNGTIDRVVAIHQATVDQTQPNDATLKVWMQANYLGTVNRIVDIHGATVLNPPTVDVAALAAALAPLLPPGVALTPDDVAAIAAAAAVTVNDELASRTSPPA